MAELSSALFQPVVAPISMNQEYATPPVVPMPRKEQQPQQEKPPKVPGGFKFTKTEVPAVASSAEQKMDALNHGDKGKNNSWCSVEMQIRTGEQASEIPEQPGLVYSYDAGQGEVRNADNTQAARNNPNALFLEQRGGLLNISINGKNISVTPEQLKDGRVLNACIAGDPNSKKSEWIGIARFNPDTRTVRLFRSNPEKDPKLLPPLWRTKWISLLPPAITTMLTSLNQGPVAPPPLVEMLPPTPPAIIREAQPVQDVVTTDEGKTYEVSMPTSVQEVLSVEPDNSTIGTFYHELARINKVQLEALTGKPLSEEGSKLIDAVQHAEVQSGENIDPSEPEVKEAAIVVKEHIVNSLMEKYGMSEEQAEEVIKDAYDTWMKGIVDRNKDFAAIQEPREDEDLEFFHTQKFQNAGLASKTPTGNDTDIPEVTDVLQEAVAKITPTSSQPTV